MKRLWGLLRLLRVTNIFTAVSDTTMAIVVSSHGWPTGPVPWFLLASSCCLYFSGMVLNDYCDLEIDREERPGRPLPAGLISVFEAGVLAAMLMVTGLICAGMASWLQADWAILILAVLLAIAIIAYDALLKQTVAGAIAMGMCRGLNVLLGMSPSVDWGSFDADYTRLAIGLALAIGTYVAGITWAARFEAEESPRVGIVAGAAVMSAGLGILASIPFLLSELPMVMEPSDWILLWSLVLVIILRRFVLAWLQPTPTRVQQAIGNAILSLIIIDAAIALGYLGVFWGCGILLLMFPATLLKAYVPPT